MGILLLLLLASGGAIWRRGLQLNFSASGRSSKVPLNYLWLSLTIELAACIGMYVSALRSGPAAEGEQQINRIRVLSRLTHNVVSRTSQPEILTSQLEVQANRSRRPTESR